MEFDFIKVNKPLDTPNINAQVEFQIGISHKLGCVVKMVVDTILPHAESGSNDHRKDAPPFSYVFFETGLDRLPWKKCVAPLELLIFNFYKKKIRENLK